jgi:hypothetical protein
MQPNWTHIYTTTNQLEAAIITDMLRAKGIETVTLNKRDSSYLAFGNIEVYCNPDEAIQALHWIQHNQQTNEK